ncbi:MAG: lipopolysaccharide biosynthesis protein [Sodaliphilus sp.]|nr:lipopolysaccharide biosynthesis protein [Sodaliphilus sp.]
MSNTSNNTRIAKNTIFLYFRMILLMVVSLYTSRVVLATLGIEDYGIYNVVGGFIGMFAFLNGAMSGCTQRFITIALGKGDEQNLKRVFSTCVITHGMIAIVVFLLAESIGLWFILEKLVIPESRMATAMIVYQCSIVSTIVMIMSFPYNADIIAHEKMSAFAYISIFEAFANLGIVYLLHVVNADKLALYAILLMLVKISVIMIYRIYCKRHFFESGFRWLFDKILLKEMLAFTSWNLFGGIAGTLMGQGINVLLNLFFGPVVNAARGVAVQVQSAVQLFSTNFQTALNPQMMKSYAAGDLQAMHVLLFRSAKFTFMLLLCLMLPLMLEINTVLGLWLKEVPKYTNIFVCLMLCISMVDAVSNPFMTASAATGRVKKYQSIVGSILLLIVPLAYISLKLGAEPYAVFIVHLTIAIIAFIARMLIIRKMIDLSIREYIKNAILPCIKVALPSIFVSLAVKYIFPNGLQYAVIVVITTLVIVLVISYLFGLTDSERRFVSSKIPILNR